MKRKKVGSLYRLLGSTIVDVMYVANYPIVEATAMEFRHMGHNCMGLLRMIEFDKDDVLVVSNWAHCVFLHAWLHKDVWDKTVNVAAYVINCYPNASDDLKTLQGDVKVSRW